MEHTSENALFSSKDAFLNVTIFLSIKRIFILRTVCKTFNSWLSDPFSFAWIKRIQSAFPLSYTDVLKEDMNQQFLRLIVIDSLVDEGHSVSYFAMTDLNPHNTRLRSFQVPWRKDLFLFLAKDLIVYNATKALITTRLPSLVVFNPFLTLPTIGLLSSNKSTMKYFRVEGDVLVHERDVTCLSNHPPTDRMVYGDNWILWTEDEENNSAKLNFRSITTAYDVATFDFSDPLDYVPSSLRPVAYVLSHDLVNATYSIFEIDCINLKKIELYNGQLNEKPTDRFSGIMQLFENENGSYLKIFWDPIMALAIFDVNSRKIVHRQFYQQQPPKEVKIEAWDNLVVFPGSPYYCTFSKSGVFTVRELTNELSTTHVEDTNTMPDKIEHLPDPYLSISLPERAFFFRWLNGDMITWRTYHKHNPRQVFFSISKRTIIGYINDLIVDIFIINDNKALSLSGNEIYEIKFDTSYLQ